MELTGKKTFWNGWDAKHLLYVLLLVGNLVFMIGFNYAKLVAIENNQIEMKNDIKDAKCAIASLKTDVEVNKSTDARQENDINDIKKKIYK